MSSWTRLQSAALWKRCWDIITLIMITWTVLICSDCPQIIFFTLASGVDNVVCTYSLKHRSINKVSDPLFRLVDASLKKGEYYYPKSWSSQGIILSAGTIQSSISKHMLKEVKQVTTYFLLRVTFLGFDIVIRFSLHQHLQRYYRWHWELRSYFSGIAALSLAELSSIEVTVRNILCFLPFRD